MKNTKFLFDVDGTLTKPRTKMTEEHADMFLRWSSDKSFILVTGSDFGKILDQVPRKILALAEMIFCCLGNEIYQPIDECNFNKLKDVIKTCQSFVDDSEYPERCGNHIEKRKGMLNVSSVGRMVTSEGRQKYFEWDKANGEREAFVKAFGLAHKDYEVSMGGMISVDIAPRGCNKGQALDHVDGKVVFFGDRIAKGGNDHALAERIEKEKRGISHEVSGPDETFQILMEKYL